MALFIYQAIQRNGQKSKGVIEADSARHARQLLRHKELIPIQLEEKKSQTKKKNKPLLTLHISFQRRIRSSELALLTRQLATLVQASLPLDECLQAVSEQSEKLHLKSLLMSLRSRIQEGYTLSDSMKEHHHVFDPMFCSMIAAGEKSSHLDRVLNRLADYTEQRERLKARLLQAMLYPLILVFVAVGVVSILLTSVIPKIIEQFEHLGHALPPSTQILIALSELFQSIGIPILCVFLAMILIIKKLLQNKKRKISFDRFILDIPIIGQVSRGLNTARFARTLSILTASGVPLLDGIQTAARVSSNRYVEQQLLIAAEFIREGSSLRAALTEIRLFPPMMLYMIASGERSGELESMLLQAADNQEHSFDLQVGIALSLFEPILIVIMAMVILFIVTAILQPMLQINNLIGI